MTPARLHECLASLHWTQRGLARILNRPQGTIRQWLDGRTRIPQDVTLWLEILAQHAERHPPPERA